MNEALKDIGTTDVREPKPDIDAAVERLAALSPREFELRRKDEAKRLNVRASFLEKEVARLRDKDEEVDKLGLFDPEPADYPVDGDDLLDRIASAIRRHVVLPPHAAEAVALWIIHSHAYELWRHTPRLHIKSPVMGSGKSTLLDVIACMIPRALKTENLSTAVMFRAIEKYRPALLVDEVDSYLQDNEELRGCLNAGHSKGAKHLRCEGDSHEVTAFNTFAPVALAGIGEFKGRLATLADRSIPVTLQRRKPDEHVRDFRDDRANDLAELASEITRWIADNESALRHADPQMPPGIHNRRADNWRPLLSIADIAGGTWPERARTAACELSTVGDGDADTYKEQLLIDIRSVFAAQAVDRIDTKSLLDALVQMEDRPWGEFRRGNALTSRQLSALLKPFKMNSGSIRLDDGRTPKGYYRSAFEEVWARYLSDSPMDVAWDQPEKTVKGAVPPILSATTPQPAENCEKSAVSIRHKTDLVADTNPQKTAETQRLWRCGGKKPENGEKNNFPPDNDDSEERAAIIEFDGGTSRAEAEAAAKQPPINPDFLQREDQTS